MLTLNQYTAEYHSGPHEVHSYPEAASQSFKKGEFVYLVDGKVTVCASDGVVIWGLALEDASGTTDTEISVLVANPETRFIASVYHSTAALALSGVANVGVKYGLMVSSNKHYVDIEDTTNDAFVIVERGPDAATDEYGKCIFKVIAAALQTDAAAT